MRLYIFCLVLLVISNFTFAGTGIERKIPLLPPDMIGTGGAGVASYSKPGMIFLNPASTSVDKNFWKIYLLNTGAGFNPEFISLYNKLSSINASEISNINFDDYIGPKASLGLNGPLGTGCVIKGFTFYVYNLMYTSFWLSPYSGLPNLNLTSLWDLGIMGGYSSALPQEWINFAKSAGIDDVYLGFMLKWVHRWKMIFERKDLLSALDYIGAFAKGSPNKGIDYGNAFGVDFGSIIKWNEIGIGDLALGIALKDLFFPFSWTRYSGSSLNYSEKVDTNTAFSPSFDIGISYVFSENALEGIWNTIFYRPAFYFDIINCVDFSESFFNKIRLGGEVKLFKLMPLRLGLNKGFITWGIGIDIPIVKIDFAYYTEEFGTFPGSNPQQIYFLNISLMIL